MWRLIVNTESHTSEIFLVNGYKYTIGRTTDCHIPIHHPTVSRVHASLTVQDDQVIIEDLDSKNGTYVGEERIKEPTVLKGTTTIRIGSVPLIFEHVDNTKSPQSSGEFLPTFGFGSYELFYLRGVALKELHDLWDFLAQSQSTLNSITHESNHPSDFFTSAFLWLHTIQPIHAYALVEYGEHLGERFEIKAGNPDLQRDNVHILWAVESCSKQIRPTWTLISADEAVMAIPWLPNQLVYMRLPVEEFLNPKTRQFLILALYLIYDRWLSLSKSTEYSLEQAHTPWTPYPFWGYSPAIHQLIQKARTTAVSHQNILINGPPGSGKLALARWIHQLSKRPGQLIVLDATEPSNPYIEDLLLKESSPHQLWWSSHHGTVVIQNLNQASPSLQEALRFWIQNPRVVSDPDSYSILLNIRWIGLVSHLPNDSMTFDIFIKPFLEILKPVTLQVPPLLDRREDLPYLATHLVQKYSQGHIVGLLADAVQLLLNYSWPGNLTELESVFHNAVQSVLKNTNFPSDQVTLLTADQLLPYLPVASVQKSSQVPGA